MNFEEAKEFQMAQKEIVAMIGALLVPLQSFSELIPNNNNEEVDLTAVRRLQPIVSSFMTKAGAISQFCTKFHYPTYYKELVRPITRIATLLGNQTLPSKKVEPTTFKVQLMTHIAGISEVMIATAQIVAPSIDANVKANNAFSAYCFISSLIGAISSELIIVDPYIDQSIFYRYLYQLPKDVNIKIVTDKDKLKGDRLKEFESIEVLFESEYPNYKREIRTDLHDRYIINETSAYSLGGSIKDAAKKADYSIVELTEQKRNELYALYA